jgi:hypothetical protein
MDEIDHMKEWERVARECRKPYADAIVVAGLDQLRALQRGEPFERVSRKLLKGTKPATRRATAANRKAILLETGTCASVAELYDVSPRTVSNIWKKGGRPVDPNGNGEVSCWPRAKPA